jgi:hypothetical protein
MAVFAVALMMASMASANVIVSYNGNSLGLFTDNGTKILDYATDLVNPQGVVTDNDGYVYVADWGRGEVRKYDITTGEFVRHVVSNPACRPTGLAFNPSNPGEIIVVADYDSGTKTQLARWNTNATNSYAVANNNLGVPYGSAYYFPGIAARGWTAGIYLAAAGSVFQKFDPTGLDIMGGDVSVGGAGAITSTSTDLFLTGYTTANNTYGYIQRLSDSALIASGIQLAPKGITNDGTNLWATLYNESLIAHYDAVSGALLGSFGVGEPVGIAYTSIWYCTSPVVGDLNLDCKVDFKDFAMMAAEWLECTRTSSMLCNE